MDIGCSEFEVMLLTGVGVMFFDFADYVHGRVLVQSVTLKIRLISYCKKWDAYQGHIPEEKAIHLFFFCIVGWDEIIAARVLLQGVP